MTSQNKEHYRKKASLWEVLLIDNYRFSIHFFKSYTHKNFEIWHSCFCICDEQFLSLPTQTQTAASSLGASVGTEVCCAIWTVLRFSLSWAWLGAAASLPNCSSKHKMSDNGICARCVGTPQAAPSMGTVLGRIHRALLFPLWSARFEVFKVNCCN